MEAKIEKKINENAIQAVNKLVGDVDNWAFGPASRGRTAHISTRRNCSLPIGTKLSQLRDTIRAQSSKAIGIGKTVPSTGPTWRISSHDGHFGASP